MNQLVCINILNWNGLKDTINCVDSLLKIDNVNYKILIIDNGSKIDEAASLKKMFSDKIDIFRVDKNLGFTGGNNYLITKAKKYNPDFFLFLNNDTEVDKDFLYYLMKTANSDSEIGIIGPLIYDFSKRDRVLYSGGKINWIFAKFSHRNEAPTSTSIEKFITGTSLLIKKEVIGKIGGLDDRFFAYFEDAAFCLTASQAGFKCVCEPKSKIYHIEGASSSKVGSFRTYLVSRNRILFVNNYTNLPYMCYFFLFNLMKLFFVIPYYFFTRQSYRIKAYVKGYIDGNLSKGGIPNI